MTYLAVYKKVNGAVDIFTVDAESNSEAHLKALELMKEQPVEFVGFLQCLKLS